MRLSFNVNQGHNFISHALGPQNYASDQITSAFYADPIISWVWRDRLFIHWVIRGWPNGPTLPTHCAII